MKAKAEIMINGPKGQSFATVEIEEKGLIHPAMAEAALAAALNYYNELPEPESHLIVNLGPSINRQRIIDKMAKE